MLTALLGSTHSGRSTILSYLVEKHKFTPVTLDSSSNSSTLSFDSPTELLEYVTSNWRSDFVTTSISTLDLEPFLKRPFFLLVGIDAPLLLRWERSGHNGSLADFVRQDDQEMYFPAQPGATLSTRSDGSLTSLSTTPDLNTALQRSHVRITNSFPSIEDLCTHLDQLELPSHHRLRPTWDVYFLSLCTLASLRSNCMKRRVGAVLVRQNRVISTGYNGTPRGLANCNEGGCPRCNSSVSSGVALDECLCLHAEENALLEAGRAEGTVLYCNTCPCLRCAVKIVQSGVHEVVYQLEYSMDARSCLIFEEACVGFRRFVPPA